MWYSDFNRPAIAPPACEECGAPREFEFQIMPQVIHYTGNTDIDFGTVLVYTCPTSCAGVAKEHVITQMS
jgi:pre-rRNA-processing protein TSR4